MGTSEIEKKSLEAHVELCAERYANLENKLNTLTERMDKMELYLMDIRNTLMSSKTSPYKLVIGIGSSVVAILLGGFVTLIITMASGGG